MATVEDYTSGRVCDQIKMVFSIYDTAEERLNGTETGQNVLAAINKFEPRKLSVEETIQLVENADQCAIGERVCRAVFTETPLTETIFLDELARGMVAAGKARYATKSEAIDNIYKYSKKSIIVSKVSGKHAEICFTWPKQCVYWNAEKHGLKCILQSS
ncbi:MAG: hypothetical protein SWH61_14720 [Thermodesulfobacteriota bacterium]|nr:hypothetical protein [Thermodesulfobacteriota bacterium]